jgi:hypothetical protein
MGTWTVTDSGLVRRDRAPVDALRQRVVTALGELRVAALSESQSTAEVVATWHPPRYPFLTLRHDSLRVDIVPELGGRLVRAIPTGGANVLCETGQGRDAPPASGYEEYTARGYRSPGWATAYAVVSRVDTTVTLRAEVNGLAVERRVTVGPGATLSVLSTYTNRTDQPLAAAPRSHPTLDAPPGSRFVYRDRTGQRVEIPVAGVVEHLLTGPDLTTQLRLVRPGGRSLRLEYVPGAFDTAFLFARGDERYASMEAWAGEHVLAPGASVSLAWVLTLE